MKIPRHLQLLVALFLGVVFGLSLNSFAGEAWLQNITNNFIAPVGQIFLRLIFMAVVPLIFSALALAVYDLGQHHGLKRVIGKTLLYTMIASTCSVLIGIALVDVIRPGEGVQISANSALENNASLLTIKQNASDTKSIAQTVVELVTKNPFETAAKALNGEILALMVFAVIFGLALSRSVKKGRGGDNPIHRFLEQLYQVSMEIIHFAMRLAPYGVFALVFNTMLKAGVDALTSLFYYVVTVVIGLLIQQFVVYSLLLRGIAKRSPWAFFKRCREVYLYAFSTASSNATLPTTLEVAEQQLKLPSKISRFVLTVGATANQNGTALFEGVTVLFLAQVYGIHLDLTQQFQVVLMSILAGVGTAGVPGGSLPLVMLLMQNVGIPAEGIGLVLGVDRFLDMCRTTINVSGDLVITALVSAGDNER